MSDPIYPQAAAVPYRVRDGRVEIMLITTLRRKRWIVPKGIVDPGMTPRESAAAEALEEAGVRGQVESSRLGTYEYRKWGGICRVDVFAMRVDEELRSWPESEMRRRRWVAADEAQRLVREEPLREMIGRAARDALADGGG